MRSSLFFLLSCLLVSAGCAEPGAGDDDDAANDDDLGDDDDAACGLSSGGSGGAMDVATWYSVPGFGPGDGSSQYEMLAYAPSSAAVTPMPVLLLVGRRMPLARADNEALFAQLGMIDWAEEHGWVVYLANPGDTGNSQINWTDSQEDADFFNASLDLLGEQYDIDLDRVHALGSSAGGRAATYLGWAHGERLASIVNHAGSNPFSPWPGTPWDSECAGLFIHDDEDPIVPRAAVQDVIDMWIDADQVTETDFEYAYEHAWVPEGLFPPMKAFFDTVCNER